MTIDRWSRLFGHYFNLTFTLSLITFLDWFENKTDTRTCIPAEELELVAHSLLIHDSVPSIQALGHMVRMALVDFEASINNIADGMPQDLSMLGAPIDLLIGALRKLPQFEDKVFFFLIDEYENYLEYQQRVVNTLVKHAGDAYTLKIGMRQLGWKVRSTLNPDQQLMYPADYALIEVEDRLQGDHFKDFATQVCQGRLDQLARMLDTEPISASQLLPGLSEDAEAKLLGVEAEVQTIKRELAREGESIDEVEKLPDLQAYLLSFWSKSQGSTLVSELQDFRKNRSEWYTRYQNYKHALLYTLRRRRRGIRKYYCGWDTFLLISNGNIRYALELVYESMKQNTVTNGGQLGPVHEDLQTAAAKLVGERALKELEGVSIYGAQLTKLVLGLGRVFSVMASDAEGHTPEVNQLYLDPTAGAPSRRQRGLLEAAVMHLALVRNSGTKLSEQAATQDYDYWLHPIFAPFFIYSYRRKRKMQLNMDLLEGLVDRPRPTIRYILSNANRFGEEELPEQLSMFEGYYASS